MSNVQHHHPKHLPVSLDYGKFAKELAEAQYAIGLLQGSQARLKNAMHLIGPLVAMEAAVSSKIEGTKSTSSDIYVYDAGGKPKHNDTPVVSNYRDAMTDAIMGITRGEKLSMHMIKSLHYTLLKDVRYKGKLGDFRDDDVWIAERETDKITEALYVPPEALHLRTYMENLLQYIEDKESDDLNLVKAGVVHYQFEAVHPFEDGNGRIGRLLIPLMLFYNGELSLPIVYSSGYFDKMPDKYRAALRKVDKTGEFEEWLAFFLTAIKEQAGETLALVDKIHNLNRHLKEKYQDSKSPYMGRFIDFLFESPAFTVPRAMDKLSTVRMTVIRLINTLEKDGVIYELEGQRGPGGTKIYLYTELLDIISV